MYGTKFKSGKPGRPVPVPQHRGGGIINEERRQAGTPATLEGNIHKSIDEADDTGVGRQAQPYLARWLEQRYGLSRNYAAVAAELMGGL
jgi:hypothetical protein